MDVSVCSAESSSPSKAGRRFRERFRRYKSCADLIGKAHVRAIRKLLRWDLLHGSIPRFDDEAGPVPERIVVHAIVNPDSDMQKLARTFLVLSRLDHHRRGPDDTA